MENKHSKTIIFIGNGFDLALGMKTGYSHFLNSLEFKELLTYRNSLAFYIEGKVDREKGKWVDVEVELGNYSKMWTSKQLEAKSKNHNSIEFNEKFNTEYEELRKALFLYLQRQNGGSSVNLELEKLIRKWKQEKDIYVVCFNYTPTAKKLFNQTIPECPVLKVHGDIEFDFDFDGNCDHSKIVFGVDETCGISDENDFLFKSSSSSINILGLKERILNAEKFIFFGCSLGETDTWYFSDLFKQATERSFHFYCYGNNEERYVKRRIRDLSNSLQDFTSKNTIEYLDSSNLSALVPSSRNLSHKNALN